MFWDVFVELCMGKEKSPTAVGLELGLTRATVSNWKKGGAPRETALRKIADYFGVSVDYLLGKTDQKEEVPSEEGTSVVVVSRSGKRFVHHLSPEQLDILNGMIDQFEKNNQ